MCVLWHALKIAFYFLIIPSLVLLVVLLLPFPPTTVTSPEVAPLTTACSHLTALDFREVTRADDRLGLLAPAAASACIRVIGLEGDKAAEVVAPLLLE